MMDCWCYCRASHTAISLFSSTLTAVNRDDGTLSKRALKYKYKYTANTTTTQLTPEARRDAWECHLVCLVLLVGDGTNNKSRLNVVQGVLRRCRGPARLLQLCVFNHPAWHISRAISSMKLSPSPDVPLPTWVA